MKLNYGILFLITFSLLHCAAIPDTTFFSLAEGQPFVTETSPQPNASLQEPIEISVKFSERIDFESMGEDSIVLVDQIQDLSILEDSARFLKDLKGNKIHRTPCQMMVESDETNVTLFPEKTLTGGDYYLVITPHLLSAQGIPFNQTPGKGPTLFVAPFQAPGDYLEGDLNPSENNSSLGPTPEALVINEFLYDGLASETDGEAFIELFGTPGGDISLYQLLLVNGADGAITDRMTLPIGSRIPSDGIFLIADLRTGSTTASNVPGADFLDQFDPQNGPDGIQLLDREGNLVDSVVYGEGTVDQSSERLPLGEGNPAPDVSGGHSLSRTDGIDTDDNFLDFTDLATPTPGQLNSNLIPDPNSDGDFPPTFLILNEILYDGLSSETDGEAFVELFGTPQGDISHYQISLINGADGAETGKITLPENSLIPEDGIFLIADLRTGSSNTSKILDTDFLANFDPQNGPDSVLLISPQGDLLDALTYGTGGLEFSSSGFPTVKGTPAVDVSGGHSLSRVDGEDTQDNAHDFVDLENPTPGFL